MPPATFQTLALLRAGELQGATHLDLRGCGLTELPAEVLRLAGTLEVLDLSGNAMSSLPDGLGQFARLHTLFASGNLFTSLPEILGRLPRLDTLGFKANQIETVCAQALAPSLRWLILTDNRIAELPPSLTDCVGLQKLMLAGNRLRHLPARIDRLERLELLRLSANQFESVQDALPEALLELPRLAWLAHAGNPFSVRHEAAGRARAGVEKVSWHELRLEGVLGEGASGTIHAARWQAPGGATRPVAVKLFKGNMTSDGLPRCEIAATLTAGSHADLVGVLGVLGDHPDGTQGLVLPRLAAHWSPLAGPPSMASCTRDIYDAGLTLPAAQAQATLRAAANAMAHLHERGLSHGDLYAHNLLVDGQGQALLSDFGAASFLPLDDPMRSKVLRAFDRRALDILRQEVAERCDAPAEVVQRARPGSRDRR